MTTNAIGSSPALSSGNPTTPTSLTAGHSKRMASISAGGTYQISSMIIQLILTNISWIIDLM